MGTWVCPGRGLLIDINTFNTIQYSSALTCLGFLGWICWIIAIANVLRAILYVGVTDVTGWLNG